MLAQPHYISRAAGQVLSPSEQVSGMPKKEQKQQLRSLFQYTSCIATVVPLKRKQKRVYNVII